ncbi:anti-sigma factor domain-containing protein [Sulfobacillus sp. DSM 109850]|uniref:Anti-sigma factor domain-containing protein n=2 Tax=Sulfobacillus harzensis TaxID=2729629 RepID=A0A7Y0Q1R0_9FIRM|nr:anti-sigma factor domain-containing protein [Sulfobacillus harzensis]
METERGRATVMLPGGAFKRIATRGLELHVGQEVWLPQSPRRWYRWLAVPALAAVATAFWIQALPSPQPVEAAVLSVDINPSVNLDVSAKGVVLGAQGLDRSGRRLLEQRRVKGLTVQNAVSTLIKMAAQDGYLKNSSNTVLIGAVFKSHPEAWFSGLSSDASGVLKEDNLSASVVAVSGVSAPLLQAMQKPQVSVGRYLVWQRTLNAAQNQTPLTLRDVKKMSVTDLVAPLVTVASRTSSPKVPQRSGASNPKAPAEASKHAAKKHYPPVVLPNLPVTVPTMVVTPPAIPTPRPQQHGRAGRRGHSGGINRHSRGIHQHSDGVGDSSGGASPSPSIPPSHLVPNPVHTVSSVVSNLGL